MPLLKQIIAAFACCFFVFASSISRAASITINEKDAVVWLERQTVSGKLNGFFTKQLIAHCNEASFPIAVKADSTFSFSVALQKGENKIFVQPAKPAAKIVSDTLTLTLGFAPVPIIRPYAVYQNGQLTLHAHLIKNPWKRKLHFAWSNDLNNPSPCIIDKKTDSVARAKLPMTNGIYYFNVMVYSGNDTARFQTYVIKSDSGVHAFDVTSDHAPWIDTAIVYEITPFNFVQAGTYNAIAAKLDEIKSLGINTIWLQPVYRSFRGGQGYDVVDYFSLREDLGTEEVLRSLIQKAKALGLRVLFDFVPNHTSVHHPYAQDAVMHGKASHYYNFYQHNVDSAAYSQFYKMNKAGFVTYFWDDLVNLNYDNDEVRRWMTEACKYWIKKFDIDGYRFDATWGLTARAPSFFNQLRLELKSIKPDLFLLAEDKGSLPSPYNAGFDAAYDWTADTAWVSHWSWQYEYDERKNFTVFNHRDVGKRVQLLKKALFQNGNTTKLRLRFVENNDLPRFVNSHSIAATKLAIGLVLSLPGIPLLYNGQEVGCKSHPYSKRGVFDSAKSIQALDSNQLFPWHQKLISLRQKYPALRNGDVDSVCIQPANKIVAFQRRKGNETFLVLLNLDSVSTTVRFNTKAVTNTTQTGSDKFEDVLSNHVFYANKEGEMEMLVEGYGIHWLLLK